MPDRIARAAAGLGGSDRCVLWLSDPANGGFIVAADRTVSGATGLPVGTRFALNDWPAARLVAVNRTPKVVRGDAGSLSSAEKALVRRSDVTSLLYVPFLVENECSGMMLLVRGRKGSFAPRHVELAVDVADHIGRALEHARLLDANRQRLAAHRALFRVSQAAVSMDDRQTVLREIARAAATVLDSESCTIQVWHRDTDEMETVARERSVQRVSREFEMVRHPLQTVRSLRFVLEQQIPLHMHPHQSGLDKAERELLARSGTESLLIVPMTIAGDTLGAILLASSRPRAFDAESLNIAQEIAAQTALAIQSARFVERTKRHVEEQTVLLRVSQAVISGSSLHEALSDIAGAALEFESVDGCRILLWNQGSERVELAAEVNASDWQTYYRTGDRYPLADWPSARVIMTERTPRAWLASDAEITARERANHVADGVMSFAAIPIVAGDECLGCLSLHSRISRRFTSESIRIGRELASQAAQAIDRARLLGQLRARAETDGLTGLLNHRAAFEALDRELALAQENGGSVGVVVVDLDDFKLFNDTHGHLTGDSVLLAVAQVLSETARPRDHVARFGGDEFLLILPNATAGAAKTIAERLAQRMDQKPISIGNLIVPIRFSIGVATFPADARSRQELVAAADSSMYAAKELGGGQVGLVNRGTRSLEVSTLGALSGLVRAVDRKDRYTKDHSDMVARYAVRFGRTLSLSPSRIEALGLAGRLHDVGKIAVPDSILRKPGYLSPEEQAMIRQHVVFSDLMIKGVPHLEDVLAAVSHHHERWDGGGYPFGKSGTQIPLLGRILALADALAAMTHDRPYRKGRSLSQALDEIRAGAGTQFDPDLVEPFVRAMMAGDKIQADTRSRELADETERSANGVSGLPRPSTAPLGGKLENELVSRSGS